MGLFKMSTGCSYNKDDPALALNPNPEEFKVIKTEQVGNLWLSIVNYPNCTNYEGMKILLTRECPSAFARLDPHFSKDSITNAGLIARFEPTTYGWKLGWYLAHQIARKDFD